MGLKALTSDVAGQRTGSLPKSTKACSHVILRGSSSRLATPEADVTLPNRFLSEVRRMACILIVDDQAEASRPLALILRHLGHEGVCVQSGEAALEYLRGKRPDLVI